MKKKEIIRNLDEYIFSSLDEGDSYAIDAYLEDIGLNLDDLNVVAEQTYKQTSFLIKAEIESQKDEALLEKVAKYFQEAINQNLEKPVSFLHEIIKSNKFALHYRNLDKLSSEEIKEIIKDHNLLEILENLENESE